jgi:hypothetical protein
MTGNKPNALAVLVDLFGSDPVDLHGAVIPNAPGLAELVLEALNAAGYIVMLFSPPPARGGRP